MAPPLTPEEERTLAELEAKRFDPEERPTESQRVLAEIERLRARRATPREVRVQQAPPPKLHSAFPRPSQWVVNLIALLGAAGLLGGGGYAVQKTVPDTPPKPPADMVRTAELEAVKAIAVQARDKADSLERERAEFEAEVGAALRHGSCEQVPGKRSGTYICGGFELRSAPQNRRIRSISLDPTVWGVE